MKSSTVKFLISAAVLAAVPTGIMMQALIDNNNQGETYDTVSGAVDWSYALQAAAILFVVSYAVSLGVIVVVREAYRAIAR